MLALNQYPGFRAHTGIHFGGLLYPHESLWSVLHKFALIHCLKGRQLRELLSCDFRSREGLWLFPAQEILSRVGAEIDLKPEELQACNTARYVPPPLAREFSANANTSKSLRFCLDCINAGFHSPIHQLICLSKCPFHKTQLVEACPECGSRLPLSASDRSIQVPYGCECGHRFWSLSSKWYSSDFAKCISSEMSAWFEWLEVIDQKFCLFMLDSEIGATSAPHSIKDEIVRSFDLLCSAGLPKGWDWDKQQGLGVVAIQLDLDDACVATEDLGSEISQSCKHTLVKWRSQARAAHQSCSLKSADSLDDSERGRDRVGYRYSHGECSVERGLSYCERFWSLHPSDSFGNTLPRLHTVVIEPVQNALYKMPIHEFDPSAWIAESAKALSSIMMSIMFSKLLTRARSRVKIFHRQRMEKKRAPSQNVYWQNHPVLIDMEKAQLILRKFNSERMIETVLERPCERSESS